MKPIENKPLTKMSDLKLNVAERKHLDLTKSEVPDLHKKLMEVVAKASKMKDVIVSFGNSNEENYLMANLTPTKRKDKTLVFQEPNPVLIYFNSGLEHIEKTLEIRKDILKTEYSPEELYPVFSEFYKEAFQGVTQLIMAMEALFNQKIPEEINLEYEGKNLTKGDIEWKDFKTKIRYIIPKLTGIDLYMEQNADYLNICSLNKLRNSLIHLKSLREDNFTHYQSLCKKLIDFDYETNCTSIRNVIILLG